MENIHEAKTHLSRLVDRAAAGEEIVIAKAGKPMARLVAFHPEPTRRVPGRWQGQVRLASDFDDTPEDLLDAFEGGSTP